ncbi:hypothetical protein IFM89_006984 [Coptis chinensis]|uniref:Uncharacterized protein n=1 Tax=Coptis chinensis TaxID=261450 RepID=A0A835HD40_9MAGN|nr:hypothetical protein IFM89_006984 [Coptis chinensis]
MEEKNKSFSSVSTNWVVCKGSLDDLITFKTPSFTDGGEKGDHRKYELVLLNFPSSDSNEPCEITVSFAQSHEIEQVYFRSSAARYEIYSKKGQSSNEFYPTSAHFEGSTNQMELTEERINNGNNPTEDGWVEVHVPDSALVESKTCSLDNKVNGSTERSIQDCYEATQNVAVLSPCISLTIRFLSIQTESCLHLEEIHIIGKPVEQLSEAGMTTGTSGEHIGDARQEIKCQDDESLSPCTGRTMSQESQSSLPNQEQVNLEDVAKGSPECTRIQSDDSVLVTGERYEFVNQVNVSSPGRIESLLDQLVCRVGRIESICLRFEENILKPISNLQTRLEQLEQKVEVLSMKSQPSDLYICTKIHAPDFSCIDSDTNSYRDDENEDTHSGVSFANKDSSFARPPQYVGDESESSFHLNGFESSVAPHVIPGLIITAPEFSIEDYDDNNDDNNGHCGGVGGDYKTGVATDGKNDRSNLSATKEPKEAPVMITDLNLGALRLGLASTSVTPKENPFGVTFENSADSVANSPFNLRVSNGEQLQPASFSLQPSQPVNVSAFHFTAPDPTSSAFCQPAYISDAQEALGSVLGGFGQSRQLGTSSPQPSSAHSVGFSGGFGAFSNQQGGGGFSAFGGSKALSGEPPSTSEFGNGEFPARTASGGFGFGNPIGGVANAATVGFGFGSPIGGFANAATGGFGFGNPIGGVANAAIRGFGFSNPIGGGANAATGGFGFGNPIGGFANAATGGFGSCGSTIGGFSEVASGAVGFVGCAGATGGGGSGFGASSNQQGGCGLSGCGSNTAGIEKPPSAARFGTGGFSTGTLGGFGVGGYGTPTSGGFANAGTGPAGGITGFEPFSNQKGRGSFSDSANPLAGRAKPPPELFTHMRK